MPNPLAALVSSASGTYSEEDAFMARSISASVGANGRNRKDDSMTVQDLLNQVPVDEGGPDPLLDVDGLPWQKTIAAIKQFQKVQVGLKFPDGRVDPNGPTLAALNKFDAPKVVEHLPMSRVFFV
jgi:peptidoglycan hydrolase-like protein with peptidoglycan-binding domain